MASSFAMRKNGIIIYAILGWKNYENMLCGLGKYKVTGTSCLEIIKLQDVDLKILEKVVKQTWVDMKKKYLVK